MASTSSKRQYSKFHLESKCRICLTKSLSDMTDLNTFLNKDSNELLIYEALETVMGEEIPLGDEFPSGLCGICLSLLSIAYDLKVEYFRSKNQLMQFALSKNSDDENTSEVLILKQEQNEDVNSVEILDTDNENLENDDNENLENDDNENLENDDIYLNCVSTINNKKQKQDPPVELLVGESTYDIRNVLVVEKSSNDEIEKTCNNFLQNLGSAITASFAETTTNKTIESFHDVKDIDMLPSSQTNEHYKETSPLISSYCCCHCKRTFGTPEYLNKHMAVCEKFKNLECYVCKKKFKERKYLVSHITNIHLTGKNVTIGGVNMRDIDLHCQVCNKLCTNKKNLSYHLSTHKEKEYSCDKCGKMFVNKTVFEKHQQIHKRETKVVCPICGKSFHYDSGLFYHMKMHTNERKYQCSFCIKTFYNLCGLKRHKRTHTGERPYICRYCNRGFRSNGERKNHEYLHTGERPFQCQICGIGFTKPYNLNIHLMTHEGDHKCSLCNKGFISEKVLIYHLKIKHGVKALKSGSIIITDENTKESELDEEVTDDPHIVGEQDHTNNLEVKNPHENVNKQEEEYYLEEYSYEISDEMDMDGL